jgi:hypothetical protein
MDMGRSREEQAMNTFWRIRCRNNLPKMTNTHSPWENQIQLKMRSLKENFKKKKGCGIFTSGHS